MANSEVFCDMWTIHLYRDPCDHGLILKFPDTVVRIWKPSKQFRRHLAVLAKVKLPLRDFLFNTEINYPEDHSLSHIFQKSEATLHIIMTPELHLLELRIRKKSETKEKKQGWGG